MRIEMDAVVYAWLQPSGATFGGFDGSSVQGRWRLNQTESAKSGIVSSGVELSTRCLFGRLQTNVGGGRVLGASRPREKCVRIY
jgi:hypothetical protein